MDYSCKNIRNMLPTYLDNMMNEMDAKTIEKHLNNCAACRREYEFLKSIMETAQDLPEIEVSDNFNETLHKNLIKAKNNKRSLYLKNIRNIAVATLSTAAVIAISVVSLGNLNDKEITTPIEVETETEVIENNLEIVSDEEIIQTPEVAEEVITESEQPDEENAEVVVEKPKSNNPIAKIFSSIPKRTAKTNKKEKETHQVDFKTPMLKIKNDGLAQGQQNSSSQQTAEEKPQETSKQSKAIPRIKMTMPNLESGVSIASAFEEAISAPIADAKPESAPQQTPAQGSGGGSSGGASSSANTPEKVKVTANVKVKDSDAELAKKILSEYEYADGEYALSNAEYKEVMGQLDAMGASITLSKEDKTERYEELSDSLENSGASQPSTSDGQIQNELNQIDDEASKKFVILD